MSTTPIATTPGSTSFFGQQQQQSASAVKSTKPDFAAARRRPLYKPGRTKYDDLLPPNYVDLVPKAAMEAFRSESEKFDWKNIPEWIPPKEVR